MKTRTFTGTELATENGSWFVENQTPAQLGFDDMDKFGDVAGDIGILSDYNDIFKGRIDGNSFRIATHVTGYIVYDETDKLVSIMDKTGELDGQVFGPVFNTEKEANEWISDNCED